MKRIFRDEKFYSQHVVSSKKNNVFERMTVIFTVIPGVECEGEVT